MYTTWCSVLTVVTYIPQQSKAIRCSLLTSVEMIPLLIQHDNSNGGMFSTCILSMMFQVKTQQRMKGSGKRS